MRNERQENRLGALPMSIDEQNGNLWIWAALVIAAGTMIRFWIIYSGQLDLVQDEAQYWDWSRRPQLSYYSKGPLISWIIAFSTSLLGQNAFAVRAGSLVFSVLTQIFLYAGVSRYWGKPRVALWLLFIANTTPFFIVSGILMTTDSPLLCCWSLALCCLLALHGTEGREPAWAWAGLVLALCFGILAKYAMLFLPVLALAHALLLKRLKIRRPGYLSKLLAAIALGTATGLLPILIWNAGNDWVSFRHVSRLSGLGGSSGAVDLSFFGNLRLDRWLEFVGSQIGLLLPWWFAFMLLGAWQACKRLRSAFTNAEFAGVKTEAACESLLLLLFLPVFAYFLFWALFNRVYPNWAGMCYVSGLIFAALAFSGLRDKARAAPDATPAAKYVPLWIGLSLFVCLAIQGQDLWTKALPLPDNLNPAQRLKGWENLGSHLDGLRGSMPNPDKVFFFSDAYDVTAELAFYVPGKPVTYCADFGRRSSQYDLWPGPQDKKGWDAFYVSRKPLESQPAQLKEMFEEVGPVINYVSSHRGMRGRSFGIVRVRNFNGTWPESAQKSY